jgi:hypothetical protein
MVTMKKSHQIPDKEVKKAWSGEAEKRFKAYKHGKVKTYDLKEVAERYKQEK